MDNAAVDGFPDDVVFDVDLSGPSATKAVIRHFYCALIVLVKRDRAVK